MKILTIIQSFVPDSDIDAEKFAPLLKKVLAEKQNDAAAYLQNVCERRPHTTSERFLYALYNYLEEEFEDTNCDVCMGARLYCCIYVDEWRMECE